MHQKDDYHVLSDELIDESIQFLPNASEMRSVEQFREYLKSALPQNAQATRDRAATYICHRFFGNGSIDRPLVAMLGAVPSHAQKRELIAYRFMLAERLVGGFATEELLGKVGAGESHVSLVEMSEYIDTVR